DRQRGVAAKAWNDLLAKGIRVEVPEPQVNEAWKNLILQNFSLINGERLLYSAGNQYESLYEAEGSDAALAMMAWGYEADTRRLLIPLLDFARKGIEFHHAGLKLRDIAEYYWQTRDPDFVKATRPKWEQEFAKIMN